MFDMTCAVRRFRKLGEEESCVMLDAMQAVKGTEKEGRNGFCSPLEHSVSPRLKPGYRVPQMSLFTDHYQTLLSGEKRSSSSPKCTKKKAKPIIARKHIKLPCCPHPRPSTRQ